MAITKKDTSKLKHIDSPLIKGAELPEDSSVPLVLFTASKGTDSTEIVLPMTQEAFARATVGAGTTHPTLSHGIVGASRFRFVVLVEQKESKTKDGGKVTMPKVVGIHCYPMDNYLDANFEGELNRKLSEDAAVVYVHEDTGELDLVAYPATLKSSMRAFVTELEKLTSIDSSTTVKSGGITYTVSGISDNEITFRCRKDRV